MLVHRGSYTKTVKTKRGTKRVIVAAKSYVKKPSYLWKKRRR